MSEKPEPCDDRLKHNGKYHGTTEIETLAVEILWEMKMGKWPTWLHQGLEKYKGELFCGDALASWIAEVVKERNHRADSKELTTLKAEMRGLEEKIKRIEKVRIKYQGIVYEICGMFDVHKIDDHGRGHTIHATVDEIVGKVKEILR